MPSRRRDHQGRRPVIDAGDALIAAVRSHAPGDTVTVTYTDAEGGNSKTVQVTLGTAPDGGR